MVQEMAARREGDNMDDPFRCVDADKVRELVGSILNHPSFRETLNDVFSPTMRASNAEQRLDQRSNSRPATPADESAQSPMTINNNRPSRPMPVHTTAAQEFVAIFRRGGSTQSQINYQNGINHRSRRGAQPYRVPNAGERQSRSVLRGRAGASGRTKSRDQTFRTKEVILLPESTTQKVVRPPKKAVLMENGFVLNELSIDKGWSSVEVLKYFEESFAGKLGPDTSDMKFPR